MPLLLHVDDAQLVLIRDDGSVIKSPGAALATPDNIISGSPALAQSRIQPTNFYTNHWSAINLTPVSCINPGIRHHGDLVYQQLQQLLSSIPHDEQDSLTLLIDGDRPAQELGLLFGILRRCGSYRLTLLEDSVALSTAVSATQIAYIQIGLAQTRLDWVSGNQMELYTDTTRRFPDLGQLALMQKLVRQASELFIHQTRFNPRHHASTEQQLFDQLSTWLADTSDSAQHSIQLNDHALNLSSNQRQDWLLAFFQPLLDALESLPEARILLAPPATAQLLYRLPLRHMVVVVDDNHLLQTLSQLTPFIDAAGKDPRLIRRLPLTTQSGESQREIESPIATHLLIDDRVYRLAGRRYFLRRSEHSLHFERDSSQHDVAVLDNGHWQSQGEVFHLNGSPLDKAHRLRFGDELTHPSLNVNIRTVEVVD